MFENWSDKAKELSDIAGFTVSNLLECKASEAERKQGLDLVDYLIRYDYKEFIEPGSRRTWTLQDLTLNWNQRKAKQ